MKLYLTIFISVFTINYSFAQSADGVVQVPEPQPLNIEGAADAYSWLSHDGLRIYFSRDNSNDAVWMAKRNSIHDNFLNPQAISIEGFTGDHDLFSCWLTQDEKTIFFVTRENNKGYKTQLYKAFYNLERNCFTNAVKINLLRDGVDESSSIFVSGPSLTEDLKQLYIYYSGDGEHIACFNSEDGINYNFKKFLNDGNNYCPGSLAANGLEYYLSIRDENHLLLKFSRPDINSEFGNPEYLKIDIIGDSNIEYYQPSVNTTLGIMSVTYGFNTWESNNLALLKLPSQTFAYDEKIISLIDEEYIQIDSILADVFSFDSTVIALVDLEVMDSSEVMSALTTPISNPSIVSTSLNGFPNPAYLTFTIDYNLSNDLENNPTLIVMNQNGQIIKRISLDHFSGTHELDLSDMSEGLYYYKIQGTTSVTETKKMLIKR